MHSNHLENQTNSNNSTIDKKIARLKRKIKKQNIALRKIIESHLNEEKKQ